MDLLCSGAQRRARVALVAFSTECNSFAPELRLQDFQELCLLRGDEILEAATSRTKAMPGELMGFITAARAYSQWELTPILAAASEAGGPVEQGTHAALVREIVERLAAAGPVDAVYLALHGAMITPTHFDVEGALIEEVRRIVAGGPVISSLDLHGKVTPAMVRGATLLAYRTNPHVDQFERGVDAMRLAAAELSGRRPNACLLHVPLIATASSTLQGAFAELMREARSRTDDDLVDIALLPGFSKADHAFNQFAIVATTYGPPQGAATAALELGRRVWRARSEFSDQILTCEQGVAAAMNAASDRSGQPICLADIGDNPGGGGSGGTLFLLRALVEAGCPGVLLGLLCDPQLVRQAEEIGAGRAGMIEFNCSSRDTFAERWRTQVRVLRLGGGVCRGRRGCLAGRSLQLGRGCLLDVRGVTVAVVSSRYQTLDPAQFELFGLDIASYRCVVLKSRAHFRAGFDEFFGDAQILLVDAGGLTSVRLERFQFENLRRPVFPLDAAMQWQARPEDLIWRKQPAAAHIAAPTGAA